MHHLQPLTRGGGCNFLRSEEEDLETTREATTFVVKLSAFTAGDVLVMDDGVFIIAQGAVMLEVVVVGLRSVDKLGMFG